ncbi:MAG: cation transporter [Oscillospiraceae bacterium]|nr:cation transporter [Oscillospiraceae bacterium]
MEQQSVYKKQQKLTVMQFLMELPNTAAVTVSAIASHSLIVWLDFIDSLGNAMSELLVILLSRKMCRDLRYEYNYGVGKIEAMTALFCDSIKLCGLLAVMVLSVIQIMVPQKPSDVLIYVILFKVLCVILDAGFVRSQYKIKKENPSSIAQSEYIAVVSALLFDAGALVSLFCVWIMRNSIVSGYISPVLSMLIAVYMFIICVKHVRQAISELSDKTLPEEEQLKILKVITKHDDEYSSFGSIKSRYNGTEVIIDISMSFSQSTTYSEIAALQKAMQEELSGEIENCHIAIIIE